MATTLSPTKMAEAAGPASGGLLFKYIGILPELGIRRDGVGQKIAVV